jgi:hypothetical protein
MIDEMQVPETKMKTPRFKDILLIETNKTVGQNIKERLERERYEIDWHRDLDEGREWLLNYYFRLAIVSEDFYNKYFPKPDEPYFPYIPKIIKENRTSYKAVEENYERWRKIGFVDVVASSNLPVLVNKVNNYFRIEFGKLNRDLLFEGDIGQLYRIIVEINPTENFNLLFQRYKEMEDLFRFLYHSYLKVALFSPIWIRNGLTAIETLAESHTSRPIEQFVTIIGKKEEYEKARENYENCFPGNPVIGCSLEKNFKALHRYGGMMYQFVGLEGDHVSNRIQSVEMMLNNGIASEVIPQMFYSHIQNATRIFSKPRSEVVIPIKNTWINLGLPEINEICEKFTETVEQCRKYAHWCNSGTIEVDQNSPFEWHITIDNNASISYDKARLQQILSDIRNNNEEQPAEVNHGFSSLHTLIMNENAIQPWVSDFRTGKEPSCQLMQLAQYEAEMRYGLARRANIDQRLALENRLNSEHSPPDISDPLIIAAEKFIYEVREMGKYNKPLLYEMVLFLHAIDRFLSLSISIASPDKINDAFVLIYSIVLFENRINHLKAQRKFEWRKEQKVTGKVTYVSDKVTLEFAQEESDIFQWLINPENKYTLSYEDYCKRIRKDNTIEHKRKNRELLQKYISNIRKQIKEKFEKAGYDETTTRQIIINVKKEAYMLNINYRK